MEYYLQLMEAIEEYECVFWNEPTGMEALYAWSVQCAEIERRIRRLQEIVRRGFEPSS